ncbi:MAG: LysR family transcriptional regulator [Treponema sp.]|jgi:DNA-binding transcriptional LysR family regulator|nr:LysR family transcriptional regulator [Treponema sp.]
MTDLEIRYFLEIVNQGLSFTRASETLYVSQPALTHHIKILGEELGVKLLDTTNKTAVRLTPAGKLYFDFFSECREKFIKVQDGAKILANQESGELHLAYMSGWDLTALLKSRETFCVAFPLIEFSIIAKGLKAMRNGLLGNQYDILVTLSDQFRGESKVCTHDYLRVPYIVFFSAKHPLAQKEDLNITDFKDDVFFCTDKEEAPFLRETHEAYCRSKGFIPHFKYLPNMESILFALQNGTGYTILDKLVRIRNDSTFKYVPLDTYLTLQFVWKANNNNRALKLFLETCVLPPPT